MVRSASSRVSNHEMPYDLILRDAAKRPLLRMRKTCKQSIPKSVQGSLSKYPHGEGRVFARLEPW
jgi:hypothetical protein